MCTDPLHAATRTADKKYISATVLKREKMTRACGFGATPASPHTADSGYTHVRMFASVFARCMPTLSPSKKGLPMGCGQSHLQNSRPVAHLGQKGKSRQCMHSWALHAFASTQQTVLLLANPFCPHVVLFQPFPVTIHVYGRTEHRLSFANSSIRIRKKDR